MTEVDGAFAVDMVQAVVDGVDSDAQSRGGNAIFVKAMEQVGLNIGFGELAHGPPGVAVEIADNLGVGLDRARAVVAQLHLSLEKYDKIRHNKKWANP